MALIVELRTGYSTASPGDGCTVIRRLDTPLDGSRPVVMALHGHGAHGYSFNPLTSYQGLHCAALAEAGALVVCPDMINLTNWGDAAALAACADCLAWAARATASGGLGGKAGPAGVFGYSMGGLCSLLLAKFYTSLVACELLWAPACDLDYFHSTAGYVPAYATAPAPGPTASNSTWTAEVDADYSPYAAASAGYRVANDYGSWRGLRIPIHVIHASDDTTVPPASSDALVAGVADPFLTKHTPAPIGGHTGLFNHIDPIAITVPFFTAHMPW